MIANIPVGGRLAGLAVAGIGLYAVSDPILLAGALAIATTLLLAARPGPPSVLGPLGRALRWPLLFATLIGLSHGLSGDWTLGAVAALRLLSLVALALAVSFATPTAAMITALTRGLTPLERLGLVNAAKVSMAIALTLRFAPMISEMAQELRDAQAARGGGSAVAVLAPLLGQSLRKADLIADAMDARGWPPPSQSPPSQSKR